MPLPFTFSTTNGSLFGDTNKLKQGLHYVPWEVLIHSGPWVCTLWGLGSKVAAGREMRGWLSQENLPSFPRCVESWWALAHIHSARAGEFSWGQWHMWVDSQLNGSGVWGSSPRDAASLDACLSTSCHVPHFTAFAAKTWNDSGLPLLRISQSSSTATRKFKQEYSGQAWELALPRTYLHSLGSFQRFGENFSME